MPEADMPVDYELSLADIREIDGLIDQLDRSGQDPGVEEFYSHSWELVTALPASLRRFLHDFRNGEPTAAARIIGLPIADSALGATPDTWRSAATTFRGRREEFYLALLAMALGDPFTWSTLQGGRMIQNIIPVPGEERQQSGHGQVLLEWHTEDSFHPYRCDYLLLLGLRNQDAVPTTLASVRDVVIPGQHRQILEEKRFLIVPDDEHVRQLALTSPDDPGLVRMQTMRAQPQPVAVLFGASDDPYLRIDPYYMRCVDGDLEAEFALKSLISELERVQRDVVVDRGTTLIVDNFRAVHGRRAFTARFDGTDRWLKKAIVTRDLRRSRAFRSASRSRVLS